MSRPVHTGTGGRKKRNRLVPFSGRSVEVVNDQRRLALGRRISDGILGITTKLVGMKDFRIRYNLLFDGETRGK